MTSTPERLSGEPVDQEDQDVPTLPADPSPYLVERAPNPEAEGCLSADVLEAICADHLYSCDDFGSTLTTLYKGKQYMVRREWDTYSLQVAQPGAWFDESVATRIADSEQEVRLEELFNQDDGHLSRGLREALESRIVSYDEYGERKVVTVEHDGRTYKLTRDDSGSAWNVQEFTEEGVEIGTGVIHRNDWLDDDSAHKSEEGETKRVHDGAFLDVIWEQDIPDRLRSMLRERGTIAGGVLEVEDDRYKYTFSQDAEYEPAAWTMRVYKKTDETQELVATTDVHEEKDVSFLAELFKTGSA